MHDETTTTIFKALADSTRLGIIRQLACASDGEACAKVRDNSNLSQPTMSHHLSKLVEAGLVDEYKEGKEKIYKLNKELLFAHGIDVDRL
jgi:ArsR family transcriptional regulator